MTLNLIRPNHISGICDKTLRVDLWFVCMLVFALLISGQYRNSSYLFSVCRSVQKLNTLIYTQGEKTNQKWDRVNRFTGSFFSDVFVSRALHSVSIAVFDFWFESGFHSVLEMIFFSCWSMEMNLSMNLNVLKTVRYPVEYLISRRVLRMALVKIDRWLSKTIRIGEKRPIYMQWISVDDDQNQSN